MSTRPLKWSGRATDVEFVDRREDGFGWIAYPNETLRRTSHALEADGDVWLVDPLDAEGLDERLSELGTVRGVVVCFTGHSRDAAKLARRHDVPVYLPKGMNAALPSDVETREFVGELGDSGYRAYEFVSLPVWREAALYHRTKRTLYVPEAVGTAEFKRVGDERLGVHPALRLIPPRSLRAPAVDRLLVGHGHGIADAPESAIDDALDSSRRNALALYAKALRLFAPFPR
jgi:hypothetical protein